MLDYGIVGNCKTAALVKRDASVEWMCYPAFSSPSIFAKIIDTQQGGSLEIKPVGKYQIQQRYLPHTAILETTFTGKKDSFKVIDFFPRYKTLLKKKHERLIQQNVFVRIIKPLQGAARIRIRYNPRPNYARSKARLFIKDNLISCRINNLHGSSFNLASNIDPPAVINSEIISLHHNLFLAAGKDVKGLSLKRCHELCQATKKYWEDWAGSLIVPETHKEIIIRSAITLKLLTYSPTGAIIAALTTSIPEEIGTDRTWDYRYCWVRDSALCADALKKLGRDYEAKQLIEFIINRVLEDDHVSIMYGINGETRLKEKLLPHLEGYRESRPVRIGNAAYNQIQHDIFGEILDLLYLFFVYYEYGKKISQRYWRFIQFIVNQIKFNWERPDSGIWEFRGELRHYTYSKFMCCIGVDRAIKIAEHYGKQRYAERWKELKEEIKKDILKRGYNKKHRSFVMSYGRQELDASLLHMTYHEFLDKDDPRLISTIRAIEKHLQKKDLVQRYTVKDDFGKSNAAFTTCSFWLIEALHYIGDKKKAEKIFHRMAKRSNHLGLFSEDIDLKTKQLTGNFPQAYTHISLINSAILLSEWSVKRKKIELIERKKRLF